MKDNKVIIIGAGIAGIKAAITLAQKGISSILVSSMPSQRAQSNMAEGGINAALDTMGENDSPVLHLEETLKAGRYLAKREAVEHLTKAAPDLVRELQAYGMSFTLTSITEKKIQLRPFGGQSKKRTAFADASTGKQLLHTLIAELRQFEADETVVRLSNHIFLGIEKQDGKLCGVSVFNRDTNEIRFIPTASVIIASGGMNGVFGNATGSVLNTGTVTASLLSSGVELANLEMIQYHPTTARMHSKNILISEAARGEGGRLFIEKDGKPYYFMEEKYPFPAMGNLMPRDVVSREEYALMKEGYQIYLELRGLDAKTYKKKLKSIVTDCKEFLHIDVKKEPIPIEPGIHFFMGGICVDTHHRTNIPGLYAAGECACQYHGANRLGGNSLLGALYGGTVAAEAAAEDSSRLFANENQGLSPHSEIRQPKVVDEKARMCYCSEKKKLQALMKSAMGIERSEASLLDAIEKVKGLMKDTAGKYDPTAYYDENLLWKKECLLCLAFLTSALQRKESRGAHQRIDFPTEQEEFRKTNVAYIKDGAVCIEQREV